ncbi:TPA: hypothetical protein N0F65_001116 [Lagenidium giganteum]|uniref:SCP domain-containing protein n=1 Tax=Lagenidium giganteum TaxID=4803 RepID=A0AAV2YII7_9STRA|nr:TPA: hypothetical protein N0F65_001116 [Lagenidium giganteum]
MTSPTYLLLVLGGLEFLAVEEIRAKLQVEYLEVCSIQEDPKYPHIKVLQGEAAVGRILLRTTSSPEEIKQLQSVQSVLGFLVKSDAIHAEGAEGPVQIAKMVCEADWAPALALWKAHVPKVRDHNAPTFRASCVRDGRHTFKSVDIAGEVGAEVINKYGWQVNLTQFDLEVVCIVFNHHLIAGIALGDPTKTSFRSSRLANEDRTFMTSTKYVSTLRPSTTYMLYQLAKCEPGDVVLDSMCGIGTIPIWSAYFANNNIIALGGEIDDLPVRSAGENAQSVPYNVNVCQWDSTRLPLRPSTVDKVILDMPFGHRCGNHRINNKIYPRIMKELHRVLRPGGRAVLLAMSKKLLVNSIQHVLFQNVATYDVNIGGLGASSYASQAARWKTGFKATSASAGSRHHSDLEGTLVRELCSAVGSSSFPPRDVLQKLTRHLPSLDHAYVCELLDAKLDDRLWQVQAKALSVLSTIFKSNGSGYYKDYYSDKIYLFDELVHSRKEMLRARAEKVVAVLQQHQQARPPVASAPPMLSTEQQPEPSPQYLKTSPIISHQAGGYYDQQGAPMAVTAPTVQTLEGPLPVTASPIVVAPSPAGATGGSAFNFLNPQSSPATEPSRPVLIHTERLPSAEPPQHEAPASAFSFLAGGAAQPVASTPAHADVFSSLPAPTPTLGPLFSNPALPPAEKPTSDPIHDAFEGLSIEDDESDPLAYVEKSPLVIEPAVPAVEQLDRSAPVQEVIFDTEVLPGPMGLVLDRSINDMAVIERFIPLPNGQRGLLELHPAICPGCALISINSIHVENKGLEEVGPILASLASSRKVLRFKKLIHNGRTVNPSTYTVPYVPPPKEESEPEIKTKDEEEEETKEVAPSSEHDGHNPATLPDLPPVDHHGMANLTPNLPPNPVMAMDHSAQPMLPPPAAPAVSYASAAIQPPSPSAVTSVHMEQLMECYRDLQKCEHDADDFAHRMAMNETIPGLRNHLAQLHGNIERIQTQGIDTVILGPNPPPNHEEVKQFRSALVRHAESLSRRIHDMIKASDMVGSSGGVSAFAFVSSGASEPSSFQSDLPEPSAFNFVGGPGPAAPPAPAPAPAPASASGFSFMTSPPSPMAPAAALPSVFAGLSMKEGEQPPSAPPTTANSAFSFLSTAPSSVAPASEAISSPTSFSFLRGAAPPSPRSDGEPAAAAPSAFSFMSGYSLLLAQVHANAHGNGEAPRTYGSDGKPNVHNSGVCSNAYTPEIRDYIVEAHSKARGSLVPTGEAANMRQLEWNEDLAISASDLVEKCQFEHYTEDYAYGQNLMYGGKTLDKATVDGWMKAWVEDEICDADRTGGGMMQLNHASAVLWADTFMVGCASKMCPNGYLTACNYFNPGNWQGKKAYPML